MIKVEKYINIKVVLAGLVSVFSGAIINISPAHAANFAHPLDPLTSQEISSAVNVLRANGKVKKDTLFPIIVLKEPSKQEISKFKPGDNINRKAFVVLMHQKDNQIIEAVVNIKNKKIETVKNIVEGQPAILAQETVWVPDAVRADKRWQQAMLKRGIKDFKKVHVEPWGMGYRFDGDPKDEKIRLTRALSSYRGDSENPYSRPVEGVIALVDLNNKKIIEIKDTGVITVAKGTNDYSEKAVGKLRTAPNPLKIVQPKGAGFKVNGNEVVWQKWHFRFAMHPREGLVLYTVKYNDNGKLRSIMHKASLSEMVVPYGDPDKNWVFRNAFDVGEYGIGKLASPFDPLNDLPDNALLLDAVFADDFGKPYIQPKTIAIYERDSGLLWKHHDVYSGHNESRRGRQLVIAFISSIGNYDYGINWIFNQDGILEMEANLTGIMLTKGVNAKSISAHNHHDETTKYGHLVEPNVLAVHHQHFFNMRLDLDVDGINNSFVEFNTSSMPAGENNQFNNAIKMDETVFSHELDAQRDMNLGSSRKWAVINPSKINSLGSPTSYVLAPGENSVIYALPDSIPRKKATFLGHHIFVTDYNEAQMYAASDYPNQAKEDQGLNKWTEDNASIENKDIVVWYTIGVTHIPRPEEWPIMNVHKTGFKLVPAGFFTKNPALDVPKNK